VIRNALPADLGALQSIFKRASLSNAGFATTTRSDQVVELVDLFVDPECMRQGIARSLLDDVVVHARTTGARRIEVDGNPHAQAFYTAVGFVTGSMVVTEFGPGLRLVRRL
jgi:ribosomal protein S18 acetylase RimI-like enzyme